MYAIQRKLNGKWIGTGERFTTKALADAKKLLLSAKYKTISYRTTKAS